jgi:O-antigen/teichoic acid export membrane protein
MSKSDGHWSLAKKIKSIYLRDFLLFVNSIITSIVIARSLGPAILGLWVALSLIASNAESFFRIKVDRAAVYAIGRNFETKKNILDSINFIAILTSLILILLINSFEDQIILFFFNNVYEIENLSLMIFFTTITLPIRFLNTNYSYYHISLQNIQVYNKMVLIAAISSSFIVVILSLIFHLGIWSIIISSLFSGILSLTYGYFKIDRNIWTKEISKLKIKENLSLKIKLIKYGFNFYVGGILSELQDQGVKNISISFLTSTKLAFLGQGQSLLKLLSSVNQAVNTILFPRISSGSTEEAVIITNTAFKISTLLLMSISFSLMISCDLIIRLLYGNEFAETATVIKILLPGVLFTEIASSLNSYFNGTGRARIIPIIQILPVLIILLLGYLLVKKIGIYGACVAMTTGNVIYSLAIIRTYLNVTRQKSKVLIPSISDLFLLFKKLQHK